MPIKHMNAAKCAAQGKRCMRLNDVVSYLSVSKSYVNRDIIGKPLRQEEIEEVEKMLRCKDPRYGFATYVCLGCGTQKIIGFSCNGRLCTYCGYRHAREYAAKLADRLLDLPYRFFTFTIPAGLRSLVNQNAELLKVVQDSMFVALQLSLYRRLWRRHTTMNWRRKHPGRD